MKTFLIFAFVLVSYSRANPMGKVKTFAKECIEEVEIDPDDVTKIRDADFSVRNEKSQCFMKCMYTKLGFFNEEFEFQPTVMIERIVKKYEMTQDEAEELINKCQEEKSDDACEYAFNIYQCFWTARDSSPAKEAEKRKAAKNAA